MVDLKKALDISPETRQKIGLTVMYGKHHSPETRQKIGLTVMYDKNMLGKHHSTEAKQKMGASKKGKPRSKTTTR